MVLRYPEAKAIPHLEVDARVEIAFGAELTTLSRSAGGPNASSSFPLTVQWTGIEVARSMSTHSGDVDSTHSTKNNGSRCMKPTPSKVRTSRCVVALGNRIVRLSSDNATGSLRRATCAGKQSAFVTGDLSAWVLGGSV
jgi:hypothetical protein